MLLKQIEIVQPGRENGNGMVMSYRTIKGTDIYCLGVPLNYSTEDEWDLGPTWCYLIAGEVPTLIDTGQFGKFEVLVSLLKDINVAPRDLKRVIITHGHEDHDGNLSEVIEASRAEVWAHYVFSSMIAYYPDIDDGANHPQFPGSCRCCVMPDKFSKGCAPYHRNRSNVRVQHPVNGVSTLADLDVQFILTPGHSPDSMCVVVDHEVLFGGDTLLATISPHPSLMLDYYVNRRILPGGYGSKDDAYGLIAYLTSLSKLIGSCGEIDLLLPGHRLFEKGRINQLRPAQRAAEIIDFHQRRCEDILRVLGNQVLTLDEIASQLFETRLRKGGGRYMAQREVMSHLELLAVCGDVVWAQAEGFSSRATGSGNYREFIKRFN